MRATDIKKISSVFALLLCAALALSACGVSRRNNAAPSNNSSNVPANNVSPGGDVPSNTENTVPVVTEDELYDDLSEICAKALGKKGGLSIYRNFKTVTTVAESGSNVINRGTEKSQTDYYREDNGAVSFIRVYYNENEDPYLGTLQVGGIRYSYTLKDMGNKQVLWKEGVAQSGCNDLPSPESLISTIPERTAVSKISFDGTTYTLSIKPSVHNVIVSVDAEASERTLSDITAYYKVNAAGSIVSSECIYTETVKEQNNTRTSNIDLIVEVDNARELKTLAWFEENSTYVRPTFADVTADMRVFYVNIPEKIIFDIRIPKIKDDLPGAEALNTLIREDFSYELSQTEQSLAKEDFGEYISYVSDYEVFRFGNYYEIVVTTTYGSAYGSGSVSKINRYVYDAVSGEQSDPEAFLEKMGYDKEKFLKTAYDLEEYTYILGRHITEVYSYEDLLMRYWFDQSGNLKFIVDSGY